MAEFVNSNSPNVSVQLRGSLRWQVADVRCAGDGFGSNYECGSHDVQNLRQFVKPTIWKQLR